MTATDDALRARFEASYLNLRGIKEPSDRMRNWLFRRAGEGYADESTDAEWNGYRAALADRDAEVRELVEADREYDAAEAGLSRNGDGPLTKRLARFNEAGKRRSVALAKFTQEKP